MRYLGIDFGLKKIGLAISEGKIASPWQILEVNNFSEAVKRVCEITKKEEFGKIVVGLPEGKMGRNVKGFVGALKKEGFDVETADEVLSSKRALQTMIDQGISQKKRRHEDAYSAAEILQNYLDQLESRV